MKKETKSKTILTMILTLAIAAIVVMFMPGCDDSGVDNDHVDIDDPAVQLEFYNGEMFAELFYSCVLESRNVTDQDIEGITNQWHEQPEDCKILADHAVSIGENIGFEKISWGNQYGKEACWWFIKDALEKCHFID